jgi:acyl-coenzyme A thioesterase PaaI-like protein
MFREHPQKHRFAQALKAGGWEPGERLPFHTSGCFGCGPDNPAGLGLQVRASEDGGVEADLVFGQRFQGAPGVVHGGAIAGAMDDVFGAVLIRELVVAVTVDLQVSYRRSLHLEEPCRLTAWLVERGGRELQITGQIEQHGRVKVEAEGRFREIEAERLLTRYERVEES